VRTIGKVKKLVVYGSYDLSVYYAGENTYNTIVSPNTPWKWVGVIQDATWTNNPHKKSIFGINNLRTLEKNVYTKKEYDYRVVYFPENGNLFSTAFIPSNPNANSISLEEAWKPLYGAPGDTAYIRFSGGKTDKTKVAWKIGEPLEVQQDLKFGNMPSGNPYSTPISGSTYETEPTSNPYMFSDQGVTITYDGGSPAAMYPLEIDLEYDNKLAYEHGYYIGSDKIRLLPPGRNPVRADITANWEDWTKMTDVLQENQFNLILPFGPAHTVTLVHCKWDHLELDKKISADIVAPKIPLTAWYATYA
jgi:hypothetical protein